MNSNDIAQEIISILKKHGHQEYGERCNMLSHSIQTGLIAKKKGYDDELILSGFLHDIGHLTPLEFNSDELKTMGDFGIEAHDKWGEIYLREKGFSERIIAPVANHVKSKRYLCFAEKDYYEKLSFASKKTLEYQGGVMTEQEAKTFEQTPFFEESVLIRKAEEEAKVKDFIILKHHYKFFEGLILELL